MEPSSHDTINNNNNNNNRRFMRRTSDCFPVRVIEAEEPNKRSIVIYFDLSREECVNMCNLSINRHSQEFQLGKQKFFLWIGSRSQSHFTWGNKKISLQLDYKVLAPDDRFGLYLSMFKSCLTSAVVKYEFSARKKPEEEFVTKRTGTLTFRTSKKKKPLRIRDLFGMTWPSLLASDFFINGMLHLRAELTIVELNEEV
ncbi:BTB/POZ domain-containing protein POB1 [Acorus gramineus]|uniref:BTB/POZ domain-containing protein POB1 n=1 Tax=Acorus gramineus TaxID=55184 RepID=A0AAV9B525_ACOGR|nr:BTB/POZ domain-containing protein POB1 [Acorus gramineus]